MWDVPEKSVDHENGEDDVDYEECFVPLAAEEGNGLDEHDGHYDGGLLDRQLGLGASIENVSKETHHDAHVPVFLLPNRCVSAV